MPCGLFGKLPARRDFISHAVPRVFLRSWEPWLEKGMSESRAVLGVAAWEDRFRAAPIWRFWLGADICGNTILGAFMPSMDAVGRYFPLTLICVADNEALVSPDADPHHAWFELVEDILLSALEPDVPVDALLERVTQLPGPGTLKAVTPSEIVQKFGHLVGDQHPVSMDELFAVCRLDYQDCSVGSATFWWTAGGEYFKPLGLVRKQFPETALFTAMLTGQAAGQGEESSAIGVKPR